MIDVNLLPDQNVLTRKGAVLQRKFLLVLAVGAALVFLDWGIFSLIRSWELAQVGDLVAKQSALATEAEQASQLAADLHTVQQKAAGISAISASRFDAARVIKIVSPLFADGVEMSNLGVDSNGGLGFSVRAQNPAVLGNFISKLVALDQSGLSKISLSGLRLEKGDILSFQVGAFYKEKK